MRHIAESALIALAAGAIVLAAPFLLPPFTCPGPGPRTQCKNNLKQIALALHNYHDQYGCFPPAYIADSRGRPMHSWRVLLLPYLEYKPLYDKYRFDEPWDGPHNRILANQRLSIFQCPEDKGSASHTSYVVVTGPKTIFPGARSVRISEITSGTTNTVLVVEVADSGIIWSEPRDFSDVEVVRGINPKSGLGISSHHDDGAQIAFADGSVRFFPISTPPGDLRAFCDRDAIKPSFPPF